MLSQESVLTLLRRQSYSVVEVWMTSSKLPNRVFTLNLWNIPWIKMKALSYRALKLSATTGSCLTAGNAAMAMYIEAVT